jgi:glycosyltransferase involved in cell wall biosynthesis
MKITAITVSVNYSDFLCWTAHANHHLFDQWIVVTDSKDLDTQHIAKHYDLDLVVTDKFYEGEDKFNKWKGINEGLKHVRNEWVLFLDSDIVLPPQSRRVISSLSLDSSCVYGVDRVDVKSVKDYVSFIQYPNMFQDSWLLRESLIGSRIVHLYGQQGDNGRFGGYKPLGYFQLVNTKSFYRYPDNSSHADHCDIQFVNNYPREKRVLIPEFFALHLISEEGWGLNWKGRKSEKFKLYND